MTYFYTRAPHTLVHNNFAARKVERAELAGVHTKVLLKWLFISRKSGCRYSADVFYKGEQISVQQKDIYEELGTREHVPTGKEARKIRRQKAFAKRNR